MGAAALTFISWTTRTASAQEQAATRRQFTVNAKRYAFDPGKLQVQKDDLVKIVLHADDIPHSFTIDAYRIAKRAGAGQTVTFEFRADQAGTFPFYCNLTADDRCKEMHGEFVVSER
jgi:nitrous-oxide reductase